MQFTELLDQYTEIKKEIRSLNNDIIRLEREGMNIEYDKVYGSSATFPFIKKSFNIEGMECQKRYKRRINTRKRHLERLLIQSMDLADEIEKFIETIEDSRTRQVFEYRYLNDYSWTMVAYKLKKSESTVRDWIHNRYLEKIEKREKSNKKI